MIYIISKKKNPISSYGLESESLFNSNSNSDNDNNKNNKIYIALPDLTKKQELKWFSDNNKNIMSEHAHNTDTRFDLKYLRKDTIKLEPHLRTYIDLKIALEIPATTMVQLAFRSSLAKKGINIRKEIINAKYIENIIVMLQNDSEKAYIIELNEKIAQAIFLSLVKIAQLVSVGNREKLEITARGIQGFGLIDRIDVLVNIAEEKIVDKKKIISTSQSISIPPYNQYMVVIEKKVKDQIQIFETKAILYKSKKIGLVNLHIPAKNHSYIKIPIYNNMENVIKILKRTTIEYLTTKIENQLPDTISDFPQLCEYIDIISQTIYRQKKCYLLQPEQLEQMNLGNLDPLQYM
ncbi:hypothetical protein G9A89_004849 [Geosiphon pyriformis]|nr:hypothetical protein G9A89_004849 [Geosiphon pyriformis]